MLVYVLAAALLCVGAGASDPVKLDFYFESMCPGCHNMFMTQLYPTYQKLGDAVMNVDLYPYGNAQTRKNADGSYTFTCQHGVEECYGNLVIACYQHYNNETAKRIAFTHCMMQGFDPYQYGESCTNSVGSSVAWSELLQCTKSWEGEELMLAIAQKTNSLNPPHQYVPWPVVDGEMNDTIYQWCSSYMLQYICQRYTGTPKPAACQSMTEEQRCYKPVDETINELSK